MNVIKETVHFLVHDDAHRNQDTRTHIELSLSIVTENGIHSESVYQLKTERFDGVSGGALGTPQTRVAFRIFPSF